MLKIKISQAGGLADFWEGRIHYNILNQFIESFM